jgi:hypothetical protein
MTWVAPYSLMTDVLRITPNGLTAQTLLDVMMQQGIPKDEASLCIRRAMERGVLGLGENLNLVVKT